MTGWQKVTAGGSRHARGYGTRWEKLRRAILRRDGGLCQPCRRAGRLTEATAVDHIVARTHGGSDDEGNLQAICDDCHRAKTAREGAAAGCRRPGVGG